MTTGICFLQDKRKLNPPQMLPQIPPGISCNLATSAQESLSYQLYQTMGLLMGNRFVCPSFNNFICEKTKIKPQYFHASAQFSSVVLNNAHFPGWCSSVDCARTVNQGVASSIPSQGTCLGCRPGPQWGPHERQSHIDVSLPSPLSINKYNL